MTPSLQIGNGKWAVKSGNELGYKIINNKYYPREMTVTRATTGTRVNADGLVELVPYNLFQYSEQFDDAYWSKIRSSILANSITAPNGMQTADKLIDSIDNNTHYLRKSISIGAYNTASIYVKKAELTKVRLGFNFSSGVYADFDLTTGTATSGSINITANIESLNNDWYRCSITSLIDVQDFFDVVLLDASGNSTFTGDGTSGVYIWGAQLVEGTEPLDYLPTTDRLNIPRVDYSTGEAALLIEPQRTNTLTYSEQFDNAAWIKLNGAITANSVASPSGVMNADTFTDDSTSGLHCIVKYSQWTATQQTFTIYVKPNTLTKFYIANGSLGSAVFFDLTTGTIDGSITGSGNPMINSTITPMANGWFRLSTTHTTSSGGTLLTGFYKVYNPASLNATAVYVGTGETGYIWGAQLEQGSYPTSYIPTTSASVTRNADVITKTDASAYIGQTEGTLFVEIENISDEPSGYILEISDNSNTNRIIIQNGTLANRLNFYAQSASGTEINTSPLNTFTDSVKIAIAYANNYYSVYANGIQILSGTSFNVPVCNKLNIGSRYNNSQFFGGLIKSVSIYKERLTDDELQTLTGGVFTTYAMMAQNLNYILQ